MMTPATAAWLLKGGMLLYSEFQGSAMSNTALLLPKNNPSLSHHLLLYVCKGQGLDHVHSAQSHADIRNP